MSALPKDIRNALRRSRGESLGSRKTNEQISSRIDYVCGFMFSPTLTQVVLIEKKKPSWQKGLLNGVGGKVEPREEPSYAMAREFKEETGVVTHPQHWSLS